jgi:adenosylmethionine-8-amino-7-oxononanoate aminotransferase
VSATRDVYDWTMREKGDATVSVRYPEGNVLLRELARDMPIISHGDGIYLFDRSGKKYIDASSGALVVSVGHGNKRVADAVHAQLTRVGYVNGTHFTSDATEQLATRLIDIATKEIPAANLKRAAFLCSGSETIEAAIKFVRQLWMERKEPERTKFIARVPSYHGNTLYALSLSGRPGYKKLFGPLLSDVVVMPSPYPYRSGLTDYEAEGAEHYARIFEETIARQGAHTIAAFIAEPVIGSSAGAAVPPNGYFSRIKSICDRHGILMIADEVLCGTGRCGAFFASSLTGFVPDVVVLGKGLGGGVAPLSALLVREDHLNEMRDGSGIFKHAQTYLQAPFITAAGVAVLDEFDHRDLVKHAARVGEHFQARLRERLLPQKLVGSVQGIGLLAGIELVEDKATKAPFARARRIIEPNVGQANGTDGDLFMLGPPLVIDEKQVDDLVEQISAALEEFSP